MVPLFYFLRHVLFVLALAAAAAVMVALVYVALLGWAIVQGGGLGSPVAWPIWVALLSGAMLVVGLLNFLPACAIGRWVTGRLGWPKLAAIPFVFAAGLALWCLPMGGLLPRGASWWPGIRFYCIWMAVPLGGYWWLTDGPGAVLERLLVRLGHWKNRIASAISRRPEP